MKKWEMLLLLALAVLLLWGAVYGAGHPDRALPRDRVYSWWGTMYPTLAGEERPEAGGYVCRLRTAELWQQLCRWLRG